MIWNPIVLWQSWRLKRTLDRIWRDVCRDIPDPTLDKQ